MKQYVDEVMMKYGIKELPGCVKLFEPIEIVELSREHLVVEMSKWDHLLNPMGFVQGGLLVAAFDNAFGVMTAIATNTIGVSVNLQTYFHKSLSPEETLRIVVKVKSKGKTILHLAAEGFNGEGDLVASAHTDLKLLASTK